MIRTAGMLCLLFVPLAAILAQVKREAKESKIFPYQINQVTLENGLKIVSVPF